MTCGNGDALHTPRHTGLFPHNDAAEATKQHATATARTCHHLLCGAVSSWSFRPASTRKKAVAPWRTALCHSASAGQTGKYTTVVSLGRLPMAAGATNGVKIRDKGKKKVRRTQDNGCGATSVFVGQSLCVYLEAYLHGSSAPDQEFQQLFIPAMFCRLHFSQHSTSVSDRQTLFSDLDSAFACRVGSGSGGGGGPRSVSAGGGSGGGGAGPTLCLLLCGGSARLLKLLLLLTFGLQRGHCGFFFVEDCISNNTMGPVSARRAFVVVRGANSNNSTQRDGQSGKGAWQFPLECVNLTDAYDNPQRSLSERRQNVSASHPLLSPAKNQG